MYKIVKYNKYCGMERVFSINLRLTSIFVVICSICICNDIGYGAMQVTHSMHI